jgi:hypothetical protein
MKNSLWLAAAAIVSLTAACGHKANQPKGQKTAPAPFSVSRATAADATRLGPFKTVLVSRPADDFGSQACFKDKAANPALIREYEPHAAANPANPDQIVATWSANTEGAYIIQGAASPDGGATWSKPVALPLTECAGGLKGAVGAGDPWVAFGPDGRVYAGAIGLNLSSDQKSFSYCALLVVTSVDGGRTWGPARVAAPNNMPIYTYDNFAVTADPSRPGTVYIASTQYQNVVPGKPLDSEEKDLEKNVVGPAAFARSTDGGETWTEMRPVTPLIAGRRVSAPLVLADPRNGRLYMVYFRENGDDALLGAISSDDQGDTWSVESVIVPFVRLTDDKTTTIKFGGKHEITTAQDIIQGAVDPVSGRVFVAFADGRHTQGRFLSVSLTSSADGESWTDPIQVNPPMDAHAWLPSVAVDGEGRLGVSYLDVWGWQPESMPTIPTKHMLGVYPLGPDGIPGTRFDYQFDVFNLLGPKGGRGGTGDYQALLGRSRGFVSIYVKHQPPGSSGVTDVMASR